MQGALVTVLPCQSPLNFICIPHGSFYFGGGWVSAHFSILVNFERLLIHRNGCSDQCAFLNDVD